MSRPVCSIFDFDPLQFCVRPRTGCRVVKKTAEPWQPVGVANLARRSVVPRGLRPHHESSAGTGLTWARRPLDHGTPYRRMTLTPLGLSGKSPTTAPVNLTHALGSLLGF